MLVKEEYNGTARNHLLDSCERFCLEKTMDDWKDFVRLKRCCYAGLKPNHVTKKCTARTKGRTCLKRQTTALHCDRTGIGTNTEDTISDESNDYGAFNA